ncbi:KIF13B [Symbiodinium natans]|uniref:KIF13B protein n=1 Tax=Symbiodinium natans TaxID=878477 RepID=A0A812RCK2_9DINO|nr:KIF13B [Symbiodinium natans]
MDDDDDLVRFATNLFFARENEGEVKLPVIRSGDPSNPCSVRCYTQDLSGQAGVRYSHVDTVLEFPTGSTLQHVTIPILTDTAWHTCEEFAVKLSEPERCFIRGGGCRVKIIDEDSFPSNDIAECLLAPNSLDDVPLRKFAWSFITLCMMQPRIKMKALVHVSISVMHNLYFLLTVFLKVYLINVLLAKAREEASRAAVAEAAVSSSSDSDSQIDSQTSRLLKEDIGGSVFGTQLLVPDNLEATALVLGMFYLIPFAILHVLDVLRARLGISGTIRRTLVSALFRRFMSFKAHERAKIPDADISMACVRDIPLLVHDGFMRGFHLIEVLLRIFVTMIFLLVQNRYTAIPFAIYPILALLWMAVRSPEMRTLQDRKLAADNAVVRGVHQACVNQDLIQDFKKRSKAVDRFWDYVVAQSKAINGCSVMDLNNSRFFPWLTTISMVAYTFFGTRQLQRGESSVGTFVATFGIFHEVGASMEAGYDTMITMFQAFQLVKNLTILLNVPTDDEDRMESTNRRLVRGIEERQALQRKPLDDPSQYIDDLINIKIIDVVYVAGLRDWNLL